MDSHRQRGAVLTSACHPADGEDGAAWRWLHALPSHWQEGRAALGLPLYLRFAGRAGRRWVVTIVILLLATQFLLIILLAIRPPALIDPRWSVGSLAATETAPRQLRVPLATPSLDNRLVQPPYGMDVRRLLTLATASDVLQRRQALIQFIWHEPMLPSRLPNSVKKGVQDQDFSGLSNLLRIDKLTILMKYGVNSIVYVFYPRKYIGKLMLYHEGHDGGFLRGKESIAFFLKKGYTVAAFAMPLLGMNSQPVVAIPRFGNLHLTSHNHFRFLTSTTFAPISFFVEPVTVTLNYLEKHYTFTSISMMGVSGGGWTTTLYAAIDPRIEQSYPVAGTLPIYLSSQVEVGDYEESLPALYRLATYPELYVLGAYGPGRRQVQILNYYDPCCYGGRGYLTYEMVVQKAVAHLEQGSFAVFLDDTHKEHKISTTALLMILAKENGG